MGRCKGNCTAKGLPLAIVQWKSCWCSDLIPNRKDQKSVSNCEDPCPGYPDDYCGGKGLYGYIELSRNGIGTAAPGVTNTKTSSMVRPPFPLTSRAAMQAMFVL
jgi:cell wall integrity and stress response component